jgi:uracil-DNA glycosylase family 4
MDSARRERYLSALGIQSWRLRGADAPAAGTVAAERPPANTAAAPAPAAQAAMPDVARPPREMPPRQPRAPAPKTAVPAPPAPAVAASPLEVPQDWTGLRAAVRDCTHCKLCMTRTQTVFGVGLESAPLMVVGEGPGADEDARGEPFVGRAGKLLDEMLAAIGRRRAADVPAQAVFIANVVKCRPPGNRDPQADEVESCRPYLDRQIELVRPRLIVALGRIAAQRLLNTDAPLSRLRGPLHHYGPTQTPLLITYHPAYLLRSPREKAKSWDDLKQIHRLLQESP